MNQGNNIVTFARDIVPGHCLQKKLYGPVSCGTIYFNQEALPEINMTADRLLYGLQ